MAPLYPGRRKLFSYRWPSADWFAATAAAPLARAVVATAAADLRLPERRQLAAVVAAAMFAGATVHLADFAADLSLIRMHLEGKRKQSKVSEIR